MPLFAFDRFSCGVARIVEREIVEPAVEENRCRIGALQLASGLVGVWAYVDTHQNPADRPSRRPLHRKWGRKPRK